MARKIAVDTGGDAGAAPPPGAAGTGLGLTRPADGPAKGFDIPRPAAAAPNMKPKVSLGGGGGGRRKPRVVRPTVSRPRAPGLQTKKRLTGFRRVF